MKKALEKLNKLSENVRLTDDPRMYSRSEVEKLIEIAYLEAKIESWKNGSLGVLEDCENQINKLLKSF